MKKIILILLVAVFCGNMVFAAEAEKKQKGNIKLPPQNTIKYWVIRSKAMTELIPFMTKKRAETKESLKLFTDYIQVLGKGEDFLKNKISVKPTQKLYAKVMGITEELKERGEDIPDKILTWEETMQFAMNFILEDGYLPVVVDGEKEFESYRNICKQNEVFAQKVQKELRENMNKCITAWTYLGTIKKQEGYKVFAFREKEAKELARKQRIGRGREESYEKARKWREERQRRDRDRYNRYYW
jgi:hypothetical protein